MNRSTCSLLPTKNDNLITRRSTIQDDRQQKRTCQKQQAYCYDKHVRQLPKLNKGDIIIIKPQKLGENKLKEGVDEMVNGSRCKLTRDRKNHIRNYLRWQQFAGRSDLTLLPLVGCCLWNHNVR